MYVKNMLQIKQYVSHINHSNQKFNCYNLEVKKFVNYVYFMINQKIRHEKSKLALIYFCLVKYY